MQVYVEKKFMKTELDERRRRWDPSLFTKKAAEALEEANVQQAEIMLPEIVQRMQTGDPKESRHGSFVGLKSDNATINQDKTVFGDIINESMPRDPRSNIASELSRPY